MAPKYKFMIPNHPRIRPIKVFIGIAFVLAISCVAPAPKKTDVPPPTVSDLALAESRATFIAVGDIMLSRGVARAIERERNPAFPFIRLAELLSSTDFNFGNLETPISGNDAVLGRNLIFNTRKSDIEGLTKYNFKIVTLANNHALDQGIAGLRHTQSYLQGRGIEHIGVGENLVEAWRPKIVTASGIRIGFVGASYASINDGGVATNPYVARIEDEVNLKAAIERLKPDCDLIVATLHAGVEYTRRPHGPQIAFARAAIDAGADIVIGHHPHWIQTLEQYQGKFIFYSLGNFIFDQRKPDTKEGLMLRISVRRKSTGDPRNSRANIDQIELLPVVIEQLGQPRPATQIETESIFRKIGVAGPILRPNL